MTGGLLFYTYALKLDKRILSALYKELLLSTETEKIREFIDVLPRINPWLSCLIWLLLASASNNHSETVSINHFSSYYNQ